MYFLPLSIAPEVLSSLMDSSHLSSQIMALVAHTCCLVPASSHPGHFYSAVRIELKDRSQDLELDIPKFGLNATINCLLGLKQHLFKKWRR